MNSTSYIKQERKAYFLFGFFLGILTTSTATAIIFLVKL